MHSRRALLYMPGDDWKKITKAITLGVDCICMDMEDGVAVNKKAEARATIAKALRELDFGKSEKLARINAVGLGMEKEDIEAVLPYRPDGIVIPKMESLEQIQWAHEIIEAAELKNGWPMNSIRVVVGVETAKGILNLKEIASHPRLDALIFGGEDFAASVGATRTQDAVELLYARQAVVTTAAAFGLQAIDIVAIDFKDIEALRKNLSSARSWDSLASRSFIRRRSSRCKPRSRQTMKPSHTPNESSKHLKRVKKKAKARTRWTAR